MQKENLKRKNQGLAPSKCTWAWVCGSKFNPPFRLVKYFLNNLESYLKCSRHQGHNFAMYYTTSAQDQSCQRSLATITFDCRSAYYTYYRIKNHFKYWNPKCTVFLERYSSSQRYETTNGFNGFRLCNKVVNCVRQQWKMHAFCYQ